MTKRERVKAALNHTQPDRTPVDFGATSVTGISASFIFKLRRELGLKEKPVRVYCPYQMLGEVDDELREWMGVDFISAWPSGNLFGFDNTPAKPFTMPDGTPVLVPEKFNTVYEPDGRLFMYAKGDHNFPPSAVMPKDGYYFDTIIRTRTVDDNALNPDDNLEEFSLLTDDALRKIERDVAEVYNNTDYSIIGGPGGTGLGDIAFVPGPMLPEPKGVRDIEEWYISPIIRPDFIKEVFARQTELSIKNLEMYRQAVGDRIDVINLCGTDFGSQLAPFISVDMFNEFYLPYYKKMTDWIHSHTSWKVFKHSCGAIEPLIESLIEAGFDILNPVQCSARGMNACELKQRFGSRIVFWGGGINTQATLPFGTPEEVRAETLERLDIFGKDGGYVFNAIHNVQFNVPPRNFIAMVEALKNR